MHRHYHVALLPSRRCLVRPDVSCQGLGKVCLLGSAVRARDHLRVVGEEVEALVRMDNQLRTAVALKKQKRKKFKSKI